MAGPNGKAGDVKVGVTGASGFVGRHIVARLRADPSLTCVAAYRTVSAAGMDDVETVAIGDLSADHDWTPLVQACDVVIHVAGLAHARDVSATLIEKVNVEAIERLVEAAAAAGISRIVLVSTVKVLGEETRPGRPFTVDDPVAPADPYAAAKAKAEDRLREGTARHGIEHVIVRPPLVYGVGVGANFRSLLRMADTALPLPFGALDNRRSLISANNLADLLVLAATSPQAANRTFLASDGQDLSTGALIRRLRVHLGRNPRLVPVPPGVLETLARMAGRSGEFRKLAGNLQVDIADTRHRLGWTPPQSIDDGLRACVEDFRAARKLAA